MRIRIGKDIKIKWAVLTDGSALPLNKEELTLELAGPNGKSQSMEFEVEGNVLTTTFYGKDQNYTGDYMLTLWKNKGKEGQSVVDKTSAFSLVRYTHQEDLAQKHDNLSATLADLGDTSLVTIDGASETTLVCNLTGYKVVEDVSDLPMEPSTIGYLVGDNLYVYVGEGGDTLDGKYKNCGPFRGLKGDRGPQGNSGYQGAAGELEVVNDLTSGGEAKALSAEMGKVLDKNKQDKLQTYHESRDCTETSIGVHNVILAQASCSGNTRSSLLLVDKDETREPEERVARLAVEKDGEGAFSSYVGAYGDKVQIGAPNVIINATGGRKAATFEATVNAGDNTSCVALSLSHTPDGQTDPVIGSKVKISDESISMKTVYDQNSAFITMDPTTSELDAYVGNEDNNSCIDIDGGTMVLNATDSLQIGVGVNGGDNTGVHIEKETVRVQTADGVTEIVANDEEGILLSGKKISMSSSSGEIEDVVGTVVSNTNAIATLKGTGEGSVSKAVTDKIAEVVAGAPADLDTLKEIADYIASDKTNAADINNTLTALKTRVYELGDFPSSGVAEAKAAEEAISRNPSISIIHYSVNHTTSHIILQDVNDNLTQQVLYYAGNTFIRHLGANLNANWKKTNPTNIEYNQDSHRIALMHMVNQYGEGDNNIDWVELPTATDSKDGLMTKAQVKSLEGKQDQLANYVEGPMGKTTIKYPNGTARVEVSNVRAALWANDDKVAIAADANGTRMLYTKTAEDGYIEHRDEISIGKHDENSATHITLTSKSTTEDTGEKITNTSTIQVNPDGISMTSPNGEINDVVKEIASKQPLLTGDEFKTINGQSIMGEGDIEIEGGEGGGIDSEPTNAVIESIEPSLVSTALRKTAQVLTEDEKEQARKNIGAQKQLQLTVKDNGNIVLSNLNGQSQEFMPATPSGDPMHYAYVSAGAEYTATTNFIVKDAPWKDMVDTIEDKAKWGFDVVDASQVKQMTINGTTYNCVQTTRISPEGTTEPRYFLVGKGSNGFWVEDETKVLHLPGHWYLNGLGDITEVEMLRCYEESPKNVGNYVSQQFGRFSKARTVNARASAYSVVDVSYLFVQNGSTEVLNIDWQIYNISNVFRSANRIRYVLNNRPPYNLNISVGYCNTAARISEAFNNATSLRVCRLSNLVQSVSFSSCGNISKPSILYTINRATPSSAITITLHADAYARLVDDADIVAALEEKPLVTLVSA